MSVERNGKTLHLLKQGAKPSRTDRIRRKIPLKGTFTQYMDDKARHKSKNYVLNLPGAIQQGKPPAEGKKGKE